MSSDSIPSRDKPGLNVLEYWRQLIGTILTLAGGAGTWAYNASQSIAQPIAGLTLHHQAKNTDGKTGSTVWQYRVLNPNLVTLRECADVRVFVDEEYDEDSHSFPSGLLIEPLNADAVYGRNGGKNALVTISHKVSGSTSPLKRGAGFGVKLYHPTRDDWSPARVELAPPGDNPIDIKTKELSWTLPSTSWMIYSACGIAIGSGFILILWGFCSSRVFLMALSKAVQPGIESAVKTGVAAFTAELYAMRQVAKTEERENTQPDKAAETMSTI
ncbi:MAG TPA: hypothetical protein VGM98_05665, partial [Schlesneria sp.]